VTRLGYCIWRLIVRRFQLSVRRRYLVLPLALLAAAALYRSGVAATERGRTFAPYIASSLPQHASGDFDGDGRADVARIQDPDGQPHISVLLSGSSAAVRLDGSVAVLIGGDVDHDGDLDLVAATATGDVLIWLNDGHGRFTLQEPFHSHTFSSEPAAVQTEPDTPTATGVTASFTAARNRAETPVVVAQIRPPTGPLGFDPRCPVPQSLRAPPATSL
jgi:VCBS repeat protein